MARLYLKFESAIIKEHSLSHDATTIGRLPDNALQIDHLAVSGHHCRILWDVDHYIIEDNNSLNGTYVNNQRINRAVLKDGDTILVGKHVLTFKEAGQAEPSGPVGTQQPTATANAWTEATVVSSNRSTGQSTNLKAAAAVAGRERIGQLSIIDGKTDAARYTLGGKLTVIGKSSMATVRLKGWFAPDIAANIMKKDGRYLIAAAEKDVRVNINGQEINGQYELQDGDVIEVAKIKAQFAFQE